MTWCVIIMTLCQTKPSLNSYNIYFFALFLFFLSNVFQMCSLILVPLYLYIDLPVCLFTIIIPSFIQNFIFIPLYPSLLHFLFLILSVDRTMYSSGFFYSLVFSKEFSPIFASFLLFALPPLSHTLTYRHVH